MISVGDAKNTRYVYLQEFPRKVGVEVFESNEPYCGNKSTYPFWKNRIYFERGNELGKIKGTSATHRVIMVLLDLPELGSTDKLDI